MSKMTEEQRTAKLQTMWPEPFQTSDDYRNMVLQLAEPAMKLLPKNPKEDRAWLGTNPKLTIDFVKVHEVTCPEQGQPYDQVMNEVYELFQGMPNTGSALAMFNVIPQANKIAIPAAMFTCIFNPNLIEGEYAWNVHRTELECGAMLGDMAWEDGTKSGCVFSWGGEAGWTYAIQYGKTRVLRDSMKKGIFNTPCKVIASKVAQFSKQHSVVWAGIGTDNLIEIPVDENNRMNMTVLESVLKELHEKDIPVAAIICTEGTTDANAFDPIKPVYDLLQKYPNNPAKYGKAVLHADAVIGFSWIAFKGYDWDTNPLGFSAESLPIIKEQYARIEQVKYCDSYVTDFHKSGFCPYPATSFNYKDREEFEGLMSYAKETSSIAAGKYTYLQERSPYNPMNYTLESSRTAIGAVSAWATLKYFGKEGFQLLNGWELERHLWIRHFIESHKEINAVVCNPTNHGWVTLYRVYDNTVKNPQEEFDKEMRDPEYRDTLIKHNKFVKAVGEKLWVWFRSGKTINGRYTPYGSYTTGYKQADYNEDWTDSEAVISALKIYPMQVHSTDETFAWVLKCVRLAMDEVLKEGYSQY